ncbi:RrF2 family transcriptional regulator [Nocardia asteroides]|uniref:RrF2 family transcriptional regulator n=1 Tax=Nocardia asteroides TaxID=1824 RepID=UPI001E46647B|nr:Rrf2 family transcriptional regulator [Nocardia asteroides]UGT56631.1 Rrf2 family transcriptional regulator [Nocardia asteroides]
MQLSPSTDIALRAVMRLAAGDDTGGRITTGIIARQVGASPRHTSKAIARLVAMGLVEAQRGRMGGLTLTAAGREIGLGALVRDLEGDREIVECAGEHPCPLIAACRLRRLLAEAKAAFYAELDRYVVADLVAGPAGRLLQLLAHPRAGIGDSQE